MKTKDYLIFELNSWRYGIETTQIQEIFKLPALTSIPSTPDAIIGLLNIRNDIIPVIHISKHISQDSLQCHVEDSVIIVPWKDFQVGVIANHVYDIQSINANDIKPTSADLLIFV